MAFPTFTKMFPCSFISIDGAPVRFRSGTRLSHSKKTTILPTVPRRRGGKRHLSTKKRRKRPYSRSARSALLSCSGNLLESGWWMDKWLSPVPRNAYSVLRTFAQQMDGGPTSARPWFFPSFHSSGCAPSGCLERCGVGFGWSGLGWAGLVCESRSCEKSRLDRRF
ncbi:hypothetical protein BD289DRAFT_184073 [Coniella lustricola]|uniref:Uncharacterized protein n=1 Tax=Coniella lustricola TaxID=2025994 RepID=A0A2T3ADA0_9PEZI|nr:hypothetical protein BD289DRAFT_184073 [Coniella lustricola]